MIKDGLIKKAHVLALHAISNLQADTRYNFSRKNIVFVYANEATMSLEACTSERGWYYLLDDLVNHGLVVVDRPDFAFNDNQNCYRIDFQELALYRCKHKDYEFLLQETKDRGPGYGLETIPKYKKKFGKYRYRRGVQQHYRKKQRQAFLDRKAASLQYQDPNDSANPCTAHGLLGEVSLNLLRKNFHFERGLKNIPESTEHLGKYAYEISRYWLNCFREETGRRDLWRNPPSNLSRWMCALLKGGKFRLRDVAEHAKWAAKQLWIKKDVFLALSFKAVNTFFKYRDGYKGRTKAAISPLKQPQRLAEPYANATSLDFETEMTTARGTIAEAFWESAPQRSIRLKILEAVGPFSYLNYFTHARFVSDTALKFRNVFERDYVRNRLYQKFCNYAHIDDGY